MEGRSLEGNDQIPSAIQTGSCRTDILSVT
jgi:hypothetical protein